MSACRDQPIMLCCCALKIHLLCSRTGIFVRLLCFILIFIKTVLLECINESIKVYHHVLLYDDCSIRIY